MPEIIKKPECNKRGKDLPSRYSSLVAGLLTTVSTW